ncbi:MAG: ATP-binding protein [Pseudomonadota bacterium]
MKTAVKLKWPQKLRPRGLTLKLLAIYLGMVVLGMALIGSATRFAFRDDFEFRIHPHLRLYVEYVMRDLGSPPQLERAKLLTHKIPVQIAFRSPRESWSTDGRDVPRPGDVEFWGRGHKRADHPRSKVRFGELGEREVAIVRAAGGTLFFFPPEIEDKWRPAMLLPPLLVLGLLAALYFLTQRLFHPLHTIRNAVVTFGEGELKQRLDIVRNDELGDVAVSFNQMAERIEQMLESKRQLLLAISHELRSPLTRAKLATAMLSSPAQRDEIEVELAEMDSLINELLETERLNEGHQALNLTAVDVNQLLLDIVNAFDGVIELDLRASNVTAQADPVRLRLAVRNLIENALKYTPDGGDKPKVTLVDETGTFDITIRDYGDGIAPEHLPHVSEPFYRADASRQRATGGFGLGLFLCRVVAEAHGGELRIASELGCGTSVTIAIAKHIRKSNDASN